MFNWWSSFTSALSFLTVLPIGQRPSIPSAVSKAQSVRFFPLVGAIIGLILQIASVAFTMIFNNQMLGSALILALGVVITGGIHLDGFIDTCDGLLSHYGRQRALAIMKDPHIGGLGATALGVLLLVKFAALIAINEPLRLWAVFFYPIVGRLGMAAAICLFGYARPRGMGASYARASTVDLGWAALFSAIVVGGIFLHHRVVFGIIRISILAGGLSLAGSYLFARYAARKLGGLTGDVYGAVNELAELLFLIAMAAA